MTNDHSSRLRIVQVVTLVSPDGSYGGPVRVAQNQAQSLSARGHQVQVFAGVQGKVHPQYFGAGVTTRLYKALSLIPGTGFAGMASPAMLPALWHTLKGADVVHLHLARDLVMLPAALLCLLRGVPFVVQTHGMIDETDRKLGKVLDCLITVRALRASKRCFWLTPEERDSLRGLLGDRDGSLDRLVNGVPASDIIAKAPGAAVEFLYLARLQKRKRPSILIEAAALLATSRDTPISVALVGPDEGEEHAVRRRIKALGSTARIRLEGALEPSRTLERMGKASVFVLPSINEPFPMSVLEAMSVGLPVIVTDSCGLAPFIMDSGAGIVCDATVGGLAAALRRYMEDPGLWESSSAAALQLTRKMFSMGSVATQLEAVYGEVKSHRTVPIATDAAPGGH
ncbi:glycosyltransferase [Paenarthrobacter sp. NPDC056912]|uniref:glycosyltransferase n=1 Tax=Paenarthrobacter sp. NPDC056912 TaxID=3345965 RepID=UPI0036732015